MNEAGSRIQRRRWWAGAFLPVLILRALIPAGFMPAVGAGSLALVFCEPGVLAAGAHAAHQHHGQDGPGHAGHLAAGDCPFAQSAAPALPALAAVAVAHPLVAHVPAIRPEDPALRFVPLRHTAARGPPALS
jgi:hypothetical protein